MKKWILKHWYLLISLQASPKAIAAGFAIGVWWGFTPFIGLKTVMAIVCAWASRTNKIAAAIGVSMHDLLLPFFFFVLYFQYRVGCLLLGKHPEKIRNIEVWAAGGGHSPLTWHSIPHFFRHLGEWFFGGCSLTVARQGLEHIWAHFQLWANDEFHSWVTWDAFHRFCMPVILGAVSVGTLLSVSSYFAMNYFVTKFQAERRIMDQLRKTGILPALPQPPSNAGV